ncbi:MAG: hypothetical protein ACFCVH_13860 [Alphaproteobacteria bacterium]
MSNALVVASDALAEVDAASFVTTGDLVARSAPAPMTIEAAEAALPDAYADGPSLGQHVQLAYTALLAEAGGNEGMFHDWPGLQRAEPGLARELGRLWGDNAPMMLKAANAGRLRLALKLYDVDRLPLEFVRHAAFASSLSSDPALIDALARAELSRHQADAGTGYQPMRNPTMNTNDMATLKAQHREAISRSYAATVNGDSGEAQRWGQVAATLSQRISGDDPIVGQGGRTA